ncbi:hypothetical protein HMPREF0762_01100 [Slackia exigua ATCC 700122]|uniref:Uncharacterized protein n=1 Tax=Slackia exigua (strain ATCC 700122 / DSM 15923 / CIP 105133 / JCM 11022 / KCTC 5966 / S-7) TaxID=649764 RepID=D0WH68_SLAES|nr:hypothetical protein HMPREF0762_01100 [Slackia exigua ATCC 700122]
MVLNWGNQGNIRLRSLLADTVRLDSLDTGDLSHRHVGGKRFGTDEWESHLNRCFARAGKR